jgi:RNA polymerase sigma factor (sigma-70 family)
LKLPNGQATSATFLARLAHGPDQAQWYEFLARYGELILSIARRHGLQRSDCEDVLQESLLEMTRSIEGFRYDPSRGRFRNYLRQIVTRATYRRIRQKYAASRQQSTNDCDVAAPTELEHGEAVWELEWRRHHVRQALRTIEAEFSELNRTAFMMCVCHGGSPLAVAESLGISVDQVYQTKSRILKRLLAVIEQQIAEEG